MNAPRRPRIAPAALLLTLAAGCDDAASGGGAPAPAPDGGADAAVCPFTGEPARPETCDGRDDDCDGLIDEDFDLQRDPAHCGACGRACDFGNGVAACVDGVCALAGCPAGTADADGDPANGCEATCAPVPGPETCDEADNDCDGRIDEDFGRAVDLENCGACGRTCRFERGEAICDDGTCRLARCDAGWGDLDGDPANGCEAPCEPDRPGPEMCDGEDNDCDGAIDEDFDLATDGEHCGACGNRCAFANGGGRCVEGACRLVGCEAGFVDADGDPANGCEARCRPTNDGVEICDEVDNDCNGTVDDGVDKANDVENCGGCGALDEAHVCRLPNAVNACVDGACAVERCEPGFADVDGDPANGCETPCEISDGGVEICDGEDDDCDGIVDEGFDLGRDLENCGACGAVCETGNAMPMCDEGRCAVAACPEGFVDADHNPRNGCEYACTPTADPTEVCDTVDNDCDGAVDEGFDIFTDLDHCGGCGQRCAPPNALALCNGGVCDMGGCDEGWFDANADPADGCELRCTPSADGIEICDGEDDDCDGAVDEGYDLARDPLHCGACDRACVHPNGLVSCREGECVFEGCREGWHDADGDPANGCEYRCTPTPDPAEICDRRDNDCDGVIDEGFDLLADLDHCGACGNVCRRAHAVTVCDEGTCRLTACEPGFADTNRNPLDGCEAACAGRPGDPEVCDGADDDCDGRVDEGFDLANDVDHCGACGNACGPANAEPLCNGGACAIRRCDPGYVDLNGRPGDGCECRITEGGLEICDGIDNDCNGIVDDPLRLVPPPEVACRSGGVCTGVEPTCADGRWTCPYPDTFQDEEDRCDGLDNDCDGQSDEGHAGLGRPCFDGVGVCREEGRLRCNDAGDGTECSAQARPDRAGAETCNDLDDDCDGTVDEDAQALVRIPGGDGVGAFLIFAYEASRTDATADEPGRSLIRACSKPGVLPWAHVDYATAQAACEAAGMSLCTAAQWERACAGAPPQTYPYGDAYDAQRCNGVDFDTDALQAGNQDEALPTGSLAGCRRSWDAAGAVFDQSGNLWEWTTEVLGDGGDARALRGGSFGNVAGGLTCGFRNAAPPDTARGNVGFRCCTP